MQPKPFINAALTSVLAVAAAAHAQSAHVTARLVKETSVAEPGKTMWLGVQFKIEDRWHIYWDGLNDTGTAPAFEVALPEGWTMGKARWCTPKRETHEGDIVDYVFEGETMVLLPLEVPRNVAVGEVAEIKIEASWLVCSNVCVPEKQSLSAQVRVGTPGGAKPVAAQAEAFAKARAAQPKPIADAGDAVKAKLEGDTLKVSAKDADRVIFMPAAASRRLANAFAEGEAKGQELSAALEAPSDGAHGVLGIVQIWKGKQSTAYWLELTDVPAVGNKPASGDVEHKPESP